MSESDASRPRSSAPYEPFPGFAEWAVAYDPGAFDAAATLLESDKAAASDEQLKEAVDTATKWAAVDTGAIEGLYDVDRGFTMSVAASATAWQNIAKVKGESVRRSIEDAIKGYEFVLDVATGRELVTEVWIKQLHATLCDSQQTYRVMTDQGWQDQRLPKGEYKVHPNSPLNLQSDEVHSYASPQDTPPEMARLVEELRSDAFGAAHPVLQAAYAHYAFVCVHPFADGNGRVSRALASVYLYRRPGVPLVIFADQKAEYIDALEAADAGNPGPFVSFVSERAIDTINMVLAGLRRRHGPSVSERISQFSSTLLGRGGLPHAELDAIALRLVSYVQDRLSAYLERSPLGDPFIAEIGQAQGYSSAPGGYRAPEAQPRVWLRVRVPAPGEAAREEQFAAVVALAAQAGSDFAVAVDERSIVEAELREVHPVISRAFEYRLDLSLEDEIGSLVEQVAEASKSALESGGYLPPQA